MHKTKPRSSHSLRGQFKLFKPDVCSYLYITLLQKVTCNIIKKLEVYIPLFFFISSTATERAKKKKHVNGEKISVVTGAIIFFLY